MALQHTSLSNMFVADSGPADAPTLLFLHGGGGAGWMWQPQIDELSRDFHCLVPDLPGHGRSAAIPFTIQGAAQQIAHLIQERAHGGTANVIGLSLGAQVLVQMLAASPQGINRALISSALLRPMAAAWLSNPSLLRWTYRLGVSPLKGSTWYTRLNMRYAAGVPEAYFKFFNEDYQRMSAESFAQVTSENMHFRLPDGLQHATMPVLVVVGKREYKVMTESARDLLAVLPNGRGVIVDVGRTTAENHNWNVNAPILFNALIRAWASDQPLPMELTAL